MLNIVERNTIIWIDILNIWIYVTELKPINIMVNFLLTSSIFNANKFS